MSVKTKTICTCDICGMEMDCDESGHNHFMNFLTVGFNIEPGEGLKDIHYEDVCKDCMIAINVAIGERVNKYKKIS